MAISKFQLKIVWLHNISEENEKYTIKVEMVFKLVLLQGPIPTAISHTFNGFQTVGCWTPSSEL